MGSQRVAHDWANTFIFHYRNERHLDQVPGLRGFPGGACDKEPACQCRRHKRCRFNPWVRKILWRSTHFSILAWRIPWTEQPGGLQSIRSQNNLTLFGDWAHRHTFHCLNKAGQLMPRAGSRLRATKLLYYSPTHCRDECLPIIICWLWYLFKDACPHLGNCQINYRRSNGKKLRIIKQYSSCNSAPE